MFVQNTNYKLYILLLFSLSFFACKEEEIELPWQELDSGTTSELNAVYFTDANTGHAVGGDTWSNGVYSITTDGGASWRSQSIADKKLFDLDFNANNIGHSVGIDGYLFSNSDPDFAQWDFHRLPNWDIMRAVCFNNQNFGVVAGGVAFNYGVLGVIDSNYQTIRLDTFQYQLDAVAFSDDQTVHIGGYGIVLRSEDRGMSWTELPITGDFFRSICFPSPTVGYMVGYSGTILKTTNNGKNWENIRDGDKIGVSDQPFRSVYFTTVNEGFIVGEDGLCWRTQDGGDSWQIVTGLPDFDFLGVFDIDGSVYIVGEDGRILRLES